MRTGVGIVNRGSWIVALLLLLVGAVTAANVSITAEVSQTNLSVGQPFRYVVSVASDGMNPPRPQLGEMPEFARVGTQTSQSISVVNGAVSATMSFIHTLVPQKAGRFTIPPARTTVGDQVIQSNAIEVEVSAAPAGGAVAPPSPPAGAAPNAPAPPSSPPAGVKVGLDLIPSKTRVYLGEPVPLSLFVYANTRLRDFKPLELSMPQGFWVEEAKLPDKPEVEVQTRGNERFGTILLRRQILFPTTTGKLKIPATRGAVQYLVRRMQRDPFDDVFNDDFFNDPFFQHARPPGFAREVVSEEWAEVQSGAVEITVLPLPTAGRPEDFSGAVGQFTVKSTLGAAEARVGEGVSLSVEIEGQGNLKGLAMPGLKEIPGLNLFTSSSDASFSATKTAYRASKRFEYVIVPLSQGAYAIPSVSFSYFDPATGTYRTAASDTLVLKVVPGAATAAGQLVAQQALGTGQKDIIDLQEVRVSTPALGGGREFIFWNLLPWALLIIGLVYYRHQVRLETDAAYSGLYLSRGVARQYLKSALRSLRQGDQAAFYLEVHQALAKFLGKRFHVSWAAVQPEALDELFGEKIPVALRQRCRVLLAACHAARYSSSHRETAERERDLKECEALIKELDRL